jgi:hypothetical protein
MSNARLLAALIAAAAFGLVGRAQADPAQSLSNGLQLVPGTKVALAYERPGTQWTKYRTILLKPLAIPANVRNGAPNGTVPEFGESYMLTDNDVTELQKAFSESFHNVLGQAGFTFVTAPGANTLVVAPQVLRIQLNAPIEDTRDDFDDGFTLSKGGGSMTIEGVLADGTTKVVLAEVADRQYGSNMWGLNNSVSNLGEARQAFDQWARDLSGRLTTP